MINSIVKDLDAIVCSHPSMMNVGGLPYLYGTLGATCPIYMSVASNLMTQILYSDIFHMIEQEEHHENFKASFPLTGINMALSKIIGVRFSQPIHLSGRSQTRLLLLLI